MKIAAKVKLLLLYGLVLGTISFGGNAAAQRAITLTPFVAWHPDGVMLAVASGEMIQIIDTETNEVLNTISGLEEQSAEPAWSPDGTKLAIAYRHEVWIWPQPWKSDDLQVEIVLRTPSGTNNSGIVSIRWHPDEGKH
jgi:WD40 repeat protein